VPVAELHVHSEYSYDGRDPVELIVAQAAAVGIDALAITDHDDFRAAAELQRLAPPAGIVPIAGMEVTSAAGHVLALGIDAPIAAGQSFAATLEAIAAAGGISVIPHPFQRSRHGVAAQVGPASMAAADAVEVYNSRLLTGRSNRRAARFARRAGLAQTAGSDAHIAEMVGQAVTVVDAPAGDAASILTAVAAGATRVEGSRTPWRISLRQFGGGVRRRIGHVLSEW
jgi:Predicted metal-dependent phosphoesterases (PHP family)